MENHNGYGPKLAIASSVLLYKLILQFACLNLFSSKGLRDKLLKEREKGESVISFYMQGITKMLFFHFTIK